MKKLLLSIAIILLLCLSYTPLCQNCWSLLTARGNILPKESSIFTFRTMVDNSGSGEWWIYGEDGANYYYFIGEENNLYVLISKNRVKADSTIVATDYKTWR